MIKGLVLGKFMPLHKGHLALIHFAVQHCDHLTVLLCHHSAEPISGAQRLLWLKETFSAQPKIFIVDVEYNPDALTDSSTPDDVHAKAWAESLKLLLPRFDVFFSSEAYGNAFATHLGARHQVFDEERNFVPVSASLIRQKLFTYWDYLPPAVKPFFVKKVALLGSESTGKTTLAERLAKQYNTCYVPEMARTVLKHTNQCTKEDLLQIATLHAQAIEKQTAGANKLLFLDTELIITKSYSRFLFAKELLVAPWIAEANKCSFYLFLETDCPFVQDGTRLSQVEREALNNSHLEEVKKSAVPYTIITGNWDQRFVRACQKIEEHTALL